MPDAILLSSLTPLTLVLLPALLLCTAVLLLRRRARTLAALLQREEEVHKTLSALGGGRWQWDLRVRRFHWEGGFFRLFGFPERTPEDLHLAEQAESARALHRAWIERIHPDDRRRLAPNYQRMREGLEPSFHAEFRLRDDQGRWRWVITRAHATRRDTQGRVLLMTGVGLDVSEQREQREASAAIDAKYAMLYSTLPDAAGITSVADGRFIDVNPAFERLTGFTREQVIGRTSLALGIWSDASERQRLLDALSEQGEMHHLALSVRRADASALPGLMSARTLRIDGEDCMVFVFHDQTQEHAMRAQLLASNTLLRQAGTMARVGVWEQVPGLGLTYWDDVCCDIHGVTPGLPLPHDYIDTHVAPAWRQSLREALRHSLRTRRAWSLELQLLRPDGAALWVRARGEPSVEHGRVVRMRGVIQDIDVSQRTLERLRASEERLARMFQHLPFPLGFTSSGDNSYLDVNPAWERLTGYTRAQALGRSVVDLGLFQAGARNAMMHKAHAQGQLIDHEIALRTHAGEQRTVLQSLTPMELSGKDCWLFSLYDISERQRAEQRVREREAQLSLTIAAATLGLWDWDLGSGQIHGDARWRELIDLPLRDAKNNAALPWTWAFAHEDSATVTQALAQHRRDPALLFDVTCRTQQGGPARWIRSLGKIVTQGGAQGQGARMVGVSIDVSRQRTQEQQLERLAHFDALTGLPNRVLLQQRLREAMARCDAAATQLGVAYLDLDGFKPVNDLLGHAAGDQLLVLLAKRLHNALSDGDCVARLGGDEFVLLLHNVASAHACGQRLQRVMDSVSAPYMIGSDRVLVTASIGYTLYPEDNADADTLMRHADQAMYAAKQSGRNRWHAFDAAQERLRANRREQGLRLARAISQGELELYLQPQVDMRAGRVVGAEALARWNHPEFGLLGPDQFLPLIDGEQELQLLFGHWVVDSALALLGRLATQAPWLSLSINISPEHLCREGFARSIALRLVLHPGLAPERLQIELTESAALLDMDLVTRELTQLRALGLRVAFDDFGTGYSSLAYLRRLPIDQLKIDRSFVGGMLSDAGDRAIVQSVIALAQSFGLELVAEGVETLGQGQALLALGCELAQGFGIARPMPLHDFIAWQRTWQPPRSWVDAPPPAPATAFASCF